MKRSQDPAEISPPHKAAREYRVYPALIERCAALEPVRAAVAHPCDESSLPGAVEAAEAGMIVPILVGPAAKIRRRGRAGRARHRALRARRRAAQPRRRRARRSSWSAPARPSS